MSGYVETWTKYECPTCEAINWFPGDWSDNANGNTLPCCRCHRCGWSWLVFDHDGEDFGDKFSERDIVDGLPEPTTEIKGQS